MRKKNKIYFSLIIPVAPDRRAEIVSSLERMDYPKDEYEIIIKKGLNPSRNRNEGAREAKGEILAFLDDDAVADVNLLKHAYNFFVINNAFRDIRLVDMVGGPQLTPPDDKFFAKACGEALTTRFAALNMSDRYKQGELNYDAGEDQITSANLFIRKESFERSGGFDESLFPGEDPEFVSRAKKKGLRVAYCPEIIIYHRRRADISGFVKQFFKYGNVRLQKERIGGTKAKPVFYIPSLFCIYLALLPLLMLLLGNEMAIPLLAYFAVGAVASFPKIRYNILYIIVLPLIFFMMHVSYGMGMIHYMLGMSK